jgi:hypothetical protein
MSLLPSFLRRRPDWSALLQHSLFVDCESAGLDPHTNGILSVGCVTIDGAEYYGECHSYSFQKIEKAALKVNGFTLEQCRDMEKDSPHECVRLFVEWVRRTLPPDTSAAPNPFLGYIVGKNPRFDHEMLKSPWDAVFAKDGPQPKPFPLSYRTIDISTIVAILWLKEGKSIPAAGLSSAVLQEYVGLPPEPSPHNALVGARYARDQFLALLEKLS